jgi:hypothetical protein
MVSIFENDSGIIPRVDTGAAQQTGTGNGYNLESHRYNNKLEFCDIRIGFFANYGNRKY